MKEIELDNIRKILGDIAIRDNLKWNEAQAKAIQKYIDENYVEKKKYDKAMKIIQEDYMKEVKRRNDAISQTM